MCYRVNASLILATRFQCALRLLRCGASVIVTTRFPTDAALRYHAERDFELWQDRLSIYGLDLRGMGMVQLFTQFVAHTHSRYTSRPRSTLSLSFLSSRILLTRVVCVVCVVW